MPDGALAGRGLQPRPGCFNDRGQKKKSSFCSHRIGKSDGSDLAIRAERGRFTEWGTIYRMGGTMDTDAKKSDKMFKAIIIFSIIATATIGGLWFWWKQRPEPVIESLPEKEAAPIAEKVPEKVEESETPQPVMDYGKMEKDVEFKALMEKRKEEYGVDKGVDMVVTPDESIKIADSTIPMQEILDKIRLKEDGLIEKDIMTGRRATPKMDERVDSGNLKERGQASGKDTFENDFADEKSKSIYGIYVVQTGDNIWNIHFEFLRDYFMKKGVTLASVSDEPNILGRSSGVGKLLKFSEKMVYIYNIKERKLDVDLNQIHPLSKIVVLNLGQAFSLLDQIDYKNVNHIEFDGETLWIPAEQ